MSRSLRAALLLSAGLAGLASAVFAAAPLQSLEVPPGFHVSVCSDPVPNARETALGTHDTVFAGSMREGKVYALTGVDKDGRAEHGSWNRSSKAGYRVVVVHVGKDGKVTGSQPFLTGFLDGQKSPGRPADVQPLRDGSLLVSDDDNGVICRITFLRSSMDAASRDDSSRHRHRDP